MTSAKAASTLENIMELSPSRAEFVCTFKNSNEAYSSLASSKI